MRGSWAKESRETSWDTTRTIRELTLNLDTDRVVALLMERLSEPLIESRFFPNTSLQTTAKSSQWRKCSSLCSYQECTSQGITKSKCKSQFKEAFAFAMMNRKTQQGQKTDTKADNILQGNSVPTNPVLERQKTYLESVCLLYVEY